MKDARSCITAGWQKSPDPVITRDISMGHWLYIAKKAKVSIVGPQGKFGGYANLSYIWRYMEKLKEGGVVQITQTTVVEITDDGLIIITPDKKEETMKGVQTE